MIRVLIVDDHEVVRMGLHNYLETEDDIAVIGEAWNGVTAVEQALALQPDVILMDLLMPGMNGIEATRELQMRKCNSRIVVLTSAVEDAMVVEALRAGALSYLLKTSTATLVAAAVRQAAKGEHMLDAQVQKSLVGQLQNKTVPAPSQDLTERELDVLRAIASGMSNQEIADVLHIGVKTVKSHIGSIFVKLGVQDRTQAAIYAIRNGLD